ncbi:MAG: class F sortase [Minisyncoccia bacterium]
MRFGVLLLAFLSLLLGMYFIVGNFYFNESSFPANIFVPPPISNFPVRIIIPNLKIDSVVKPVGLTKQKSMDVPKGPMETGWYSLGPRPGDIGSSVIAGHRGFRTGPAVFDNLHKIKVGDEVHVEDDKGVNYVFVVREIRTYGAKENIPEVWNKNDIAHLNLITCSGKWNPVTRTSDERLVVFTDLVN